MRGNLVNGPADGAVCQTWRTQGGRHRQVKRLVYEGPGDQVLLCLGADEHGGWRLRSLGRRLRSLGSSSRWSCSKGRISDHQTFATQQQYL